MPKTKSPPTTKRGRPAVAPAAALTERINVRLTPGQLDALRRYRDSLGVPNLHDTAAARTALLDGLAAKGFM